MNNYHDWVFNALVIVSVGWTMFSIIYSISANDIGIFAALMVVGLLMIGIFGWCLVGGVHQVVKLRETIPAKVLTLPTSVIVTVDDVPVKTVTDVPTYQYLSSKSTINVIREGWINIYGTTNWMNGYSLDFSK